MSEQEINEENLNNAFAEEPQDIGIAELLLKYEKEIEDSGNKVKKYTIDELEDMIKTNRFDNSLSELLEYFESQPTNETVPVDTLFNVINSTLNNNTPVALLPLPAGISKEQAAELDEHWAKVHEEDEPTDEELYVLDQQIKTFKDGLPQIERVMRFAQNLEADKFLSKAVRLLDIAAIYRFDKERAKKELLAEFKVDILLKLNDVLGQSEDDESVGYKLQQYEKLR